MLTGGTCDNLIPISENSVVFVLKILIRYQVPLLKVILSLAFADLAKAYLVKLSSVTLVPTINKADPSGRTDQALG